MPMRILPFLLLAVLLLPTGATAQVETVPAPDARPSPMRLAATTIGDAYVKVMYSAPEKRGRAIFGGLVPFDQVWRTGANEATEILFTSPVVVAGTPVAAGVYSVFTIPGESEWTIILNSTLGQWGAFSHDPETDAYRIQVPARVVNTDHEAFTMSLTEGETETEWVLNWERTEVRIPITLP